MKAFFLRLVLFVLLFLGIDFIIGQVLERAFFNVKSGALYTSLYGFRDTRDELLIFGASEASHSFITNLVEDSLKISCYNLGLDGYNIYYQYALLEQILKRHSPKIVIITTHVIEEKENSISLLFPYRHRYEEVNNVIYEITPSEKIKLLSRAYSYNSLIIKIIQGLFVPEPPTNGYKPLNTAGFADKLDTLDFNLSPSLRTINYLDRFIKLAVDSGSEVVLVNLPKYLYNSNHVSQHGLTGLIHKYPIFYLDYENDTAFINYPQFFKDRTHLNHIGAQVFTRKFITDLRSKGIDQYHQLN